MAFFMDAFVLLVLVFLLLGFFEIEVTYGRSEANEYGYYGDE